MQSLNIKEWNSWVTDSTQITQCKHTKGGVDLIMSKFNTPKNIIKCAQNKRCTSSMCEQSLCKVWIYRNENCWSVTDYSNQTPPTHCIADGKNV